MEAGSDTTLPEKPQGRRCPKCDGVGRLEGEDGFGDGWICRACDGTGNRYHAMLLRAYRLGWSEGIEAMRNAMPVTPDAGDGIRRDHNQLVEKLVNEDWDS